jgi:predicted ATPase
MGSLISRVKLRNYKSIGSCDVRLSDLCVLVGSNGAGKSNFVDSFKFVSDACNATLDTAMRNRGGLSAVRRKSGGHPNNFGMSFSINLPDRRNAFFAFVVSALPGERFEVKREQVEISDPDPSRRFGYLVERGEIKAFSEASAKPDVRPDRLFLTSVAGLKPFDSLFDALSGISVFDINPDEFRYPRPHEAGDVLDPTGVNLASVLRRLSETSPKAYNRVCEYLKRIVPGIESVLSKSLGPTETVQFSQYIQGQKAPWKFDALNMSSGTLRSLGVLIALFHREASASSPVPFIGIEEPEGTIHPGAAAVLMDAIIEAAKDRQVILTTHSPQLLDHPDVDDRSLFVVSSYKNETRIGGADEASRSAIRDELFTAGELLRANQLTTEKSAITSISQSDLFAHSA